MRRHHMDRVLIVGAGPTGLTAALELSRLGIPVRIIDKQAAPPTTSRAVGVQARTLELLELRGLADEMVRIGNPGLAAVAAAPGRPVSESGRLCRGDGGHGRGGRRRMLLMSPSLSTPARVLR